MVFTCIYSVFWMSQSAKMHAILVCFRISMFFPQRSHNFIIWTLDPLTKWSVFGEIRVFAHVFTLSTCAVETLSCLRQFMSAHLQQLWVLCVSQSPLKSSNASSNLSGFQTQTARDGLFHSVHMESIVPVCPDNTLSVCTTLPCVCNVHEHHLWSERI